MVRRLLGSAVLAFAAVATVAACSFGSISVDKDKVAQEVSDQLEGEVGRAPESVTCPGDLKAEVGTTMRCKLDDAGVTYGVEVKVTKVEGTDVKFDIKVDDEPQ
jgi:membrane protein implicated in regulation of membrane protease activity